MVILQTSLESAIFCLFVFCCLKKKTRGICHRAQGNKQKKLGYRRQSVSYMDRKLSAFHRQMTILLLVSRKLKSCKFSPPLNRITNVLRLITRILLLCLYISSDIKWKALQSSSHLGPVLFSAVTKIG